MHAFMQDLWTHAADWCICDCGGPAADSATCISHCLLAAGLPTVKIIMLEKKRRVAAFHYCNADIVEVRTYTSHWLAQKCNTKAAENLL